MYRKILVAVILVTITNILSANSEERRKRAGNPRNKNYDLCSRVFDLSNATIIKTSDSLKNGAKYLGAVQANTRNACERSCCSTDSCNVAVLEEKAKSSSFGDCFLFDCGSLDDFKCVFAVHANYVSLGMMVNRVDLEKTRIHEQTKHELDLKILKTPPDQQQRQPDSSDQGVTTIAAENQQPVVGQQWNDDQYRQQALVENRQQLDSRTSSTQQDNGGLIYQQPVYNNGQSNQQLNNNGGGLINDYGQHPQPQRSHEQRPYQQRQSVSENQIQRPSYQRQQIIDHPSVDDPALSIANVDQQDNDQPLLRKRPPVGDNPVAQTDRISKPKPLMNSKVDQPQRPPIRADQVPRQTSNNRISCGRYQWACASGDQCIAVYDRCSGIVQCRDGSDEQNCDQVANPPKEPPSYDDSNSQNSGSPSGREKRPPQNSASWGGYANGDGYQKGKQQSGQQQNPLPVQQSGNVNDGKQQLQQQNGYIPKSTHQEHGNQKVDETAVQQKPKPQHPSPLIADPAPEVSAKKDSRVEFISIQKLDSSAATNGGETASLAIVMLGLGMSILALCLLFLSCRLRKVRRRVRRGKVLDTEEGEFLVNGMYL